MKDRGRNGKVGIALAGGGPLGGIYEIGALAALEQTLRGVKLAQCDVYVGVSSGAFVAALLANGFAPGEMYDMLIPDRSPVDPFAGDLLFRPAFGEFARRMASAPNLVRLAVLGYFGRSPGRGFFESFMRLGRALPTGLFDNNAIAAYLARLFGQPGRTDDFRRLSRKLFIVATDLDSGRAAPFGSRGLDEVPISEAVKASAALPGLYPPARIGDRDYVDGALKKTLHASVALRAGAKLLFCINPIVPYDGDLAVKRGEPRIRLSDMGLPTLLSQTFRALVHSRMRVGMERYAKEFPDADIVLFEPAQDDAVIFFANMFSYADRRRLADHAYRHTLAELRRRADELEPVLRRHGIELDGAVLADFDEGLPSASSQTGALWGSVAPLGRTLSRLEKTLTEHGRRRSRGTKRHAAKAAPTNA
ncbi:MAG TPA: patatin-like phospholipase family protein [Roseiarcus sp.]|nr:patatin-like phospholipase family protein [Roseiarcus sp.]